MLCDLIQCEYSLPVETDFSNIGPLLNSVSNGAPLEITCGQVFFFFLPAAGFVNIQRPSAQVLKLLLWDVATRRQHFFLPNSGYLGNQSL